MATNSEWGVRPIAPESIRRVLVAGFVNLFTVGAVVVGISLTAKHLSSAVGVGTMGWLALSAGLVVGATVLWFPTFAQRRFAAIAFGLLYGFGLALTAGAVWAGPRYWVACVAYLSIATFGFYVLERRAALLLLGVMMGEYAVLLATQRGYVSPVAQWLFVAVAVAAAAVTVGDLVNRADRLAESERRACSEIAAINSHLEQRVAEQVGELERLGRLRRFLSPQVADALLAVEDEGLLAPPTSDRGLLL